MEQAFSGLDFAAIIFNILVGIGLPILLIVLIRKKCRMRIGPLFVGACAYIGTNMFLQGIVDTLIYVITPLAEFFANNEMPRSIFFGLLHGVVQLGGYYLIMHLFMKDFRRKENSLLFGVGVRLIDSVMAYGLSAGLNQLIFAISINSQGIESYLAGLGTENIEENRATLEQMVQVPFSELIGVGLIGLSLMFMTIAVSVLIFQAAKRPGKKYLLPTAGAVCVLNNLFMELYSAQIIESIVACVLLLLALAVLSSILAYFVYKNDTDEERGKADIIVDAAAQKAAPAETSMREKIARVSKSMTPSVTEEEKEEKVEKEESAEVSEKEKEK